MQDGHRDISNVFRHVSSLLSFVDSVHCCGILLHQFAHHTPCALEVLEHSAEDDVSARIVAVDAVLFHAFFSFNGLVNNCTLVAKRAERLEESSECDAVPNADNVVDAEHSRKVGKFLDTIESGPGVCACRTDFNIVPAFAAVTNHSCCLCCCRSAFVLLVPKFCDFGRLALLHHSGVVFKIRTT